MGWARILYWLLPRRLRYTWPLLAIASFGILAAVTLMAVGAVYSRGLAEGGVRHFLSTTDATILDAQVIVQNRPLGHADYQNLRTNVEQVIQENLDHIVVRILRDDRAQAVDTDKLRANLARCLGHLGRVDFEMVDGFETGPRMKHRWVVSKLQDRPKTGNSS